MNPDAVANLPAWYDLILGKLEPIVAGVTKLGGEGEPRNGQMTTYQQNLQWCWRQSFRMNSNLIPRDLYQSSEAPAAGSEDETNHYLLFYLTNCYWIQ